MTTAAVLLAAGQGSRFSGPTHKLLAEVDGRSLVEHALEAALGGGLDEVIVVTGAVDLKAVLAPFGDRIVVVHNPSFARGQATSLDRAITEAAVRGHDRVVVGLADQPFVTPQAWSMRVDGKDLRQITNVEGGIANLKVSPTGKHIAFTANVKLDKTGGLTEAMALPFRSMFCGGALATEAESIGFDP